VLSCQTVTANDDDDGFPSGKRSDAGFDKVKARRAARAPERPGEHCRAEPGAHTPVVDRHRCEGKADCVAVCPYGVFEVRRMDDDDFRALSFFGRLKSRVHGRQTAYVPGSDGCRACGLCVVACPEHAIALVRRAGT
jgi:4Fe-4S ferredoxin